MDNENDELENEEEIEQPSPSSRVKNSIVKKGKKQAAKKAAQAAGKAIATIWGLIPLWVKLIILVLVLGLLVFIYKKEKIDKTTENIKGGINNFFGSFTGETVSENSGASGSSNVTISGFTPVGNTEEEKKQSVENEIKRRKELVEYFEKNSSFLLFKLSDINLAYNTYVSNYTDDKNPTSLERNLYESFTKKFGENDVSDNDSASRIVSENQKIELYKHLMLTEKYNFNKATWNWYGHGHNGDSVPLKEDKEIGIKYPTSSALDNTGSTSEVDVMQIEDTSDKEMFSKLMTPYTQSWLIPFSFYSSLIAETNDAQASERFAYCILKNMYSKIIVNRYDVQKYILNTKFNDYMLYNYASKFTITFEKYKEYTEHKEYDKYILGLIPIGDPNKITYSASYKYKLSDNQDFNITEIKVGDGKYVNERVNSDGNIQPSLEEKITTKEAGKRTGKYITVKYFVSEAQTFDVKIASKYNYIQYNENDVINITNPKTEKEIRVEDYEDDENIENKMTTEKINNVIRDSKSINQIAKELNATIDSNSTDNTLNSNFDTPIRDIVEEIDGKLDKKPENTEASKILTVTFKCNDTYSKKIGKASNLDNPEDHKVQGTHYIVRTWEDSLKLENSKSESYTLDDVKEFNKESQSFEKDLGSESDTNSSRNYYNKLEKEGKLTLIDIMNSKKELFDDYLVSQYAYSKTVGYSRTFLEQGYSVLKKEFANVLEKNKSYPYKYGNTLGFKDLVKNFKGSDVFGSGLFIFPVPEYVKNGRKLKSPSEDSKGIITSFFGLYDPWGNGNVKQHGALDISGGGTPEIAAAASGEVITAVTDVSAEGDQSGGYGNYVVIDHKNGYYTLYGHMQYQSVRVSAGDMVKRGQIIGIMGSTGNSTGVHLHFEVRKENESNPGFNNAEKIDPAQFYNEDLSPKGGGVCLSENTPELTENQKQELLEAMRAEGLAKSKAWADKGAWTLQYYRDNPVELLARVMKSEISAPETEAGIYIIAAHMKAFVNKCGGPEGVYDTIMSGYITPDYNNNAGDAVNATPPQFYRQLAAAALDEVLPNPPGFLGTEQYWIGSADGVYVSNTSESNHHAYNNNNLQTCGYEMSSSSFHVFLTPNDTQSGTNLLVPGTKTQNYGKGSLYLFKLNEDAKIADGVYVNKGHGADNESSNIDEIKEIMGYY